MLSTARSRSLSRGDKDSPPAWSSRISPSVPAPETSSSPRCVNFQAQIYRLQCSAERTKSPGRAQTGISARTRQAENPYLLGSVIWIVLWITSVSYTHLRAHETDSYLVCRLLLEKKKKTK